MKKIGKKFSNFIKLIKNNKQAKILSLGVTLVLFIFSVGYALSYFNASNNKKFANITVNDLSFNMTTNNGASDDRVLHLKPNKTESFSIVLTSLNKIDVKYELIYSYCNDSICSNPSDTKIDDILVDVTEESIKTINGTISPGSANKKVINIFTQNYTSNDVYIKLNLNAGYVWNELELVDQFHLDSVNAGFATQMNIVAYVDGVETSSFPDSCNYIAKIRGYNDSSEIVMGDSSLTCDREKNTWKLVLEGLVKKVVIQFIYVPGVPSFTYTGNYEIVNGDKADWKIRLLSSGTLIFTDQNPTIDIFIVGGGGNGVAGSDYWGAKSAGGSSGGGGAALTVSGFPATKTTEYGVVIGDKLANSSFGLGGTAYYTALAGGTGADCEYSNSGASTGSAGSGGSGRLSNQNDNYGAKSVVARAGASGNGKAGNYEFDEEGNTRYGASGGYGGGGVSSYIGGNGDAGSAGGTNGGGAGGQGCSYVNNGGWSFITAVSGGAGSVNSGSGGGGGGGRCGSNSTSYGGAAGNGGAGGSGIVIIRATKDI